MDRRPFIIRLASPDVIPETIPLKRLASLLSALHSLFSHFEPKVKQPQLSGAKPLEFSLERIEKSGSTSLVLVANDQERAMVAYSDATETLRSRWKDAEASRYAKAFREIADNLLTPVEFYAPGALKPDVEIMPKEQPEPIKTSGSTTLYGVLERVGGVEPKAALRTSSGLVSITLDRDFARKLAPRLYERIGLSGMAIWNVDTWQILDFRPTEILDYRPGTIAQAFEELRNAGPRAWSKEYLESISFDVHEGGRDA